MANKLFSVMSTSFENFDQTVRTYLAKTFNALGMQYSHSQIFGVIFDGIKGVMQNAMFYIEDALTEQNVFMASRKKSVYSLAKISGYDPYYGAAATGTLIAQVKITNGLKSNSSKIYVDNYATIVNKTTGLSYVLMLNSNKYLFDLSAPLIAHEFKIVQGYYMKSRYAATGEALEKVSVDVSGSFDRNYLDVYVNGEKWNQVSCLYDMTENSKDYILTVGYENTFDIMFGNGVYGKIPESGSSIIVEYISHSGSSGNVGLNDSSRFEFLQGGYDSYGNVVNINNFVSLKVNNVISGGMDSDSISFVRDMIGYNSRSNVLASEDNFILFFRRFSFVGHVNCWAETNSMTITASCTSNLLEQLKEYNDYYSVNPDDMLLTYEQKLMITNTLDNSNKAFAGVTVKFQDPIIRKYSILCYLKIKDVYNKATVKQNVLDAYAKYFMNLKENVQFIPKSDLIKVALDSNDEIESFDIDIISKLAEDTFHNGYYYKYVLKMVNDTYDYVEQKVFYEKESTPGLDAYGNIQLDSKLEIPMLSGGFRYYADKDSAINAQSGVTVDAVQFFFI